MELARHSARHVHNAASAPERAYGREQQQALSRTAFAAAKAEITSWPGYKPTPLVPLPGLARRLGIGGLVYKDEGQRFGLLSFKALGGAYAVLRVLQQHLKDHDHPGVTAAQLIAGRHRPIVSMLTVAAATDGNHGRSVAWGAQMFGCRCKIYLHSHVSDRRQREIAKYDAQIVRVTGGYDDSVRQCAEDAQKNGWFLIADTNSGGGDAAVPAMVMQGYTVMVDELLAQLGKTRPTHVFVQGGVGGLAAAVAGHLWETLGAKRPRVVVVEPMKADCIYRSIVAGQPTPVPGDVNTFMACLAAGEISPLAWPILRTAADDVVTLPDEAAPDAMRLLAAGIDGDRPLVAGESGCAAVAGLVACMQEPKLAKALGLGAHSQVVAIGSEGATDPETYARVVGRSAGAVEQGVGG